MPASSPSYAGQSSVPAWLAETVRLAHAESSGEVFARFPPPGESVQESAVLMLFGPSFDAARRGHRADVAPVAPHTRTAPHRCADANALQCSGPGDVSVVLTARSRTLRSHPGQVSFPGGRLDHGDSGPTDAALREAGEEVGVDRTGVEIVGHLPALFLTPSNNTVTPVVGWWNTPVPLQVVEPAEVEAVRYVPLRELLDPANRFMVVHPGGPRAPGFEASGLFVWGFTAMLLEVIFQLAGFERPWDQRVSREVPEQVVR